MDSHPSPPPFLPAPTPAPAFAPTTSSRRLVNIDFARGMALFGILVVNTAILFGPLDTLIRPLSAEGTAGVNWWVALFVLVLFQGKFVAMFSLLFGYGLLGQIERGLIRPLRCGLKRKSRRFGTAHGWMPTFSDPRIGCSCW